MRVLLPIVLALVLAVAAISSTACSFSVTGQVAAEGTVTAGPVYLNGSEIIPQFDIVKGKVTVYMSSNPPYLTVELLPGVVPAEVLRQPMSPKMVDAVEKGYLLFKQGGAKIPYTAFPYIAR